MYDLFEDKKFVYLVMEMCEGGELFDFIAAKGSLTEGQAQHAFRQLMEAISYLHNKKGVCHRDLKPENLMFVSKDGRVLKLIDFGISRMFDLEGGKTTETKNLITIVGSVLYVAPEIFDGPYDKKCDIWSAGVILYIMLSGKEARSLSIAAAFECVLLICL